MLGGHYKGGAVDGDRGGVDGSGPGSGWINCRDPQFQTLFIYWDHGMKKVEDHYCRRNKMKRERRQL